MFSIFGKKKPAETPTEDPIQGPEVSPQKQNNGDDFIFVERKTDTDPATTNASNTGMMYPPIPLAPYGALPYPNPTGIRAAANNVMTPTNYLQDIPFELSPQIMTKERYNGTQMEVDGIIAYMTRQLSIDESAEDYTFALERSIQNECY